MNILVVNAGSSSHKLSLFSLKNTDFSVPLWKGEIDWGVNPPFLQVKTEQANLKQELQSSDKDKGLSELLNFLWQGTTQVLKSLSEIDYVGHRVVHGGKIFVQPTLIDAAVKQKMEQLNPLAPLHNPESLKEIELLQSLLPSIPQVAVFDTAYHRTLCEEAKTYPLPESWRSYGIEHYGFHGISHHYCAERIEELLGQKDLKIVNCHLGSGCSLCAIQEGKSFNTTMGFTPLDGLMMGTRSGSIDPAIVLYLIQEKKLQVEEVEQILNYQSGLKGIAGTADMRQLETRMDPQAQLALNMFVFRLKSFIGQMAANLGGIDVLSFTGGIGEHSAYVREKCCEGLEFLSLKLDKTKNQKNEGDGLLSTENSVVKILVIKTQEEWMIAKAIFSKFSR